MNHLRDLLDSLKKEVMAPNSIISTDNLIRLADWCETVGEHAVCFMIGDIDSTLELQVIPELVRLPYSTCWFETEVRPPSEPGVVITAGLLIDRRENGECAGLVWSKFRGNWVLLGQITGAEGNPYQWISSATSKELADQVISTTHAVHAFLSALHCSNVRREEHSPSEKLQRARAKRGKAPLFSSWTLQLDDRSKRSDDKGGTHASPRVHLVRGHPRQYALNKWTWVQAYAKGNKALGVVHKDYAASTLKVGAGGTAT